MPKGKTDTTQTVRPWRGKPCSALDCHRPNYGHGLCERHYRWAQNGTEYSVGRNRKGYKPGKDVTSSGAHSRVTAMWGKAAQYPCIKGGEPAKDWAYDGTDPTELYSPSWGDGSEDGGGWCFYSTHPEFYMPMCRKCHRTLDGRVAKRELWEYRMWKHQTGETLADGREPKQIGTRYLIGWEGLSERLDDDEHFSLKLAGLPTMESVSAIEDCLDAAAEVIKSNVGLRSPNGSRRAYCYPQRDAIAKGGVM